MDIVREPEGVDFTVISTPNSPEVAAMMAACIAIAKKRDATNEKRRVKRASAKTNNQRPHNTVS